MWGSGEFAPVTATPLRIRMRITDVAAHAADPETKRPARELVQAVAIADGSNYDRAWSITGPPGWATLSLEVTRPEVLGAFIKGRILDVAVDLLTPQEVTIKPEAIGARAAVKGIGAS